MSAEILFRAALLEALSADARLSAMVNGVYEEAPVKASPPYIVLRPGLAGDWSTKDRRGRELRLALSVHDAGRAPDAIGGIAARAERAIEAMPPDLDGWRIVGLVFLRSRLGRDADGGWSVLIEYRARLLET